MERKNKPMKVSAFLLALLMLTSCGTSLLSEETSANGITGQETGDVNASESGAVEETVPAETTDDTSVEL